MDGDYFQNGLARYLSRMASRGTPNALSYSVGDQQKTMPWSAEQEQGFQRDMRETSPYADWERQFSAKYREQPNLNDPNYNYRLAYALGAKPQEYPHDPGMMHWTSAAPVAPYEAPADLKGHDHQTLWMEKFMREYGVDPYEAEIEQMQDAIRRGIVPMKR